MDYKKGDVVLVNFNPQRKSDEVGKVRPAVIVSDTDLNEVLDLVTVVAFTTNLIDDALPLRVRIPKRDLLKEESDAMCEQIRSVSKTRIMERLTTLTKTEIELIDQGIRQMLGL